MNFQVIARSGLNIRQTPATDFDPVGVLVPGQVVIVPPTAGWTPILLEGDQGDEVGWVASKYLVAATNLPAPPVPSLKPAIKAGDPPWIAWARTKLGVKEVPGTGDNPEIVSWDKLIAGFPASMLHDSTPWCAIFVHAAFYYGGYSEAKDIESARAVDWLKFGVPVTNPKLGDVVVFDFGGGDHHVTFVLSVSGGMVHTIGGNQHDAVTLASYSTDYVMADGYRRAA